MASFKVIEFDTIQYMGVSRASVRGKVKPLRALTPDFVTSPM
jgi:hypothetical protein